MVEFATYLRGSKAAHPAGKSDEMYSCGNPKMIAGKPIASSRNSQDFDMLSWERMRLAVKLKLSLTV